MLRWFQSVIDPLITRYAHTLSLKRFPYVMPGDFPLSGGHCRRKVDIMVASRAGTSMCWNEVRAVGELKCNAKASDLDLTVLQLANYVREIFGTQPGRRQVHAFTLCRANMRLWTFDRAGAVGSTIIDIHKQPAIFVAAMLRFATMDAREVGFDPTIRWGTENTDAIFDPTVHRKSLPGQGPFVRISCRRGGNATAEHKLLLYPRPLACRFAINTRGSICWKARWADSPDDEWSLIVKDQWRVSDREREGDFLRLLELPTPQPQTPGFTSPEPKAPEPTTQEHQKSEPRLSKPLLPADGLPEYIWHGDTDSTDLLRDGLSFLAGVGSRYPPKFTKTSKRLAQESIPKLNRIHTRLVLSPVGQELLQSISYTQLLRAIHAALRG